jgi:hypothetical protein
MKKLTILSLLITTLIVSGCGSEPTTTTTTTTTTQTTETTTTNTPPAETKDPTAKLFDAYKKIETLSVAKKDPSSTSRDDASKTLSVSFLPTEEKPKFDNFSININDCSFGCKYVQDVTTFKQQYETPGRTVESGSINVLGKSLYFVTNAIGGNDPNTMVYFYFEQDGHFVSATLNDGYSNPGSALDKTEARLLAGNLLEEILKQTMAQ